MGSLGLKLGSGEDTGEVSGEVSGWVVYSAPEPPEPRGLSWSVNTCRGELHLFALTLLFFFFLPHNLKDFLLYYLSSYFLHERCPAHDPLSAGGAVAHLGPVPAGLAHRVALGHVSAGYKVLDAKAGVACHLSALPNVDWRFHLSEANGALQLIP